MDNNFPESRGSFPELRVCQFHSVRITIRGGDTGEVKKSKKNLETLEKVGIRSLRFKLLSAQS